MPVSATVNVKLEIPVNSTWGLDCTVEQIKKQAIDDARSMFINMCNDKGIRVSNVEFTSVNIRGI